MIKTIHWSFDPYSTLPQTWERSLEILSHFQQTNQNLEIIPTYFVGHDLVHWISNMTPTHINHIVPSVEKRMEERLQEFTGLKFSKPEIVVSEGTTLREDVLVARDFFKESNSDLVVLNTHARKGLERMFLGSFAESLLLQSHTPLLFVSPHTQPITQLKNVFYPTDFSKSSQKIFLKFLDRYGDFLKKISLYSKVISPTSAFADSVSQSLGGGWVSLEHYLGETRKERLALAQGWEKLVRSKGLDVEILIDEAPGSFFDSVLQTLKQGHFQLVMAPSFSDTAETLLIGSLARQLVRNATLPILVEHFDDSEK